MKVGDVFRGAYLRATDLNGKARLFTIDHVHLETMDGKQKPVVQFVGEDQELVLNKTNALMIADWLGEEMDNWRNQQVVLYPDRTTMEGRMVDCIRVRKPRNQHTTPPEPRHAPPAAPVSTQPAPVTPEPEEEDDVPF